MPRIVALITPLAQVAIVGQIGVHKVVGMQTIVAFKRLESALAHQHPKVGIRGNSESVQPGDVCCHMRFAHQHGPQSQLAQIVAHGPLANGQGNVVPRRAVREYKRTYATARTPETGNAHG